MKKSILNAIIAIAVLVAPVTSYAAFSEEFYTYGGFDAVVSAFTKCGLLFGASDYKSFFAVLATGSLAALIMRILVGIAFGSRDLHGGQNYLTGALVPWLITCAVFIGVIIPKGTLHIYDPTENRYQAVGGIPDLIVLFAGTTNKIERTFVEMVSTTGDPVGFESQAGGKGFLGLYSISQASLQSSDPLLDQSLKNYITDCVLFETSRLPGYVQEIRTETTDLLSSLAKGVNPANYTTVYDKTLSPQGETLSCTDAWANIQPRIMAADSLTKNLTDTCTELGFDPGNASSLNDCMNTMSGVVGTQLLAGKTSMDFLRNMYVAQIMDSVLSNSDAGTGYANFNILNKASGAMNSINGWLPYIRATILAVTIALTPFICLLMLTPMMPRAAKFVFGSFTFLTIWGTCDAILHQFCVDYANKLYGEVRQYSMGIDALRFFPGSTEKILAMFGLVRGSGMALAGAITSGVVGLGSSVAASVGGKLMGEVSATGTQAEQQMLDPAAKANVRKANQTAIPTETLANEFSWSQRQMGEYGRIAGDLRQQGGSIQGAGGMSRYLDMRDGQGKAASYRGQGDVELNEQFMDQAQAMGIPRIEAQKMAAATVNHGEGIAELQRLQQQGFTGQQAADTYWQGKTVDHMMSRSTGQQDGFTLSRPTAGQETGRWGQIVATWQGTQLVGLQGNSVGVVDTDTIRAGWDKSFGQSFSEVRRAEQSIGEGFTSSWGNSGTWSRITAASQQLYTATGGTVDWSKSISSSVMSSLRNSTAIDERTGQTIDKSAWAQISAGMGTPQVSPIKASIEGGASWRITTSDGKSYTVHQSAEEAKSTQESIGQTWRTTQSQIRSSNYSETAQKALSQMESITGTKTASETASKAYQQALDINERKNEALSRATEARTTLDRDFYSFIGQQQFGGGAHGDRLAIKHIEGLAANGQTDEINKMRQAYYTDRGITPQSLGMGMPTVNGPNVGAIQHAVEPVDNKINSTTSELKQQLEEQPNLKSSRKSNPAAAVATELKVKPGAVDPEDIQSGISDNKEQINEGRAAIINEGRGETTRTERNSLHTTDRGNIDQEPEKAPATTTTPATASDNVPAQPVDRPSREHKEQAEPATHLRQSEVVTPLTTQTTQSQDSTVNTQRAAKTAHVTKSAHGQPAPQPSSEQKQAETAAQFHQTEMAIPFTPQSTQSQDPDMNAPLATQSAHKAKPSPEQPISQPSREHKEQTEPATHLRQSEVVTPLTAQTTQPQDSMVNTQRATQTAHVTKSAHGQPAPQPSSGQKQAEPAVQFHQAEMAMPFTPQSTQLLNIAKNTPTTAQAEYETKPVHEQPDSKPSRGKNQGAAKRQTKAEHVQQLPNNMTSSGSTTQKIFRTVHQPGDKIHAVPDIDTKKP